MYLNKAVTILSTIFKRRYAKRKLQSGISAVKANVLFCYQQRWDITQNVRQNPQTLTLTDDWAMLMVLTFGIHTGISEKEQSC